MEPGVLCEVMEMFGCQIVLPQVGRLIDLVDGFLFSHGDGRGLIMSLGALHLSIMDVGSM